MKPTAFEHVFVEFIPTDLRDGMLYVSIPYATVVHRCACGCGNKVVTPISPTDWQLLFDGQSISLTPSIGNWGFPCRSHYWIKSNTVKWAARWTDVQIATGRLRDTADREAYFANRVPVEEGPVVQSQKPSSRRRFERLRRWLGLG
jgi:hypothetical protein